MELSVRARSVASPVTAIIVTRNTQISSLSEACLKKATQKKWNKIYFFSRYNVIFSRECVNVCDFKKMNRCTSTK